MTLLSEYYVPGLHIEDRSIKVPLDWTGHEPGHGFDGESISLFYRVVTSPEHVHDDLPLLVFLQGGPGGSGPRPLGPSSDGWIEEAIKHFRVVLPDQRGTGRSSRVDTHVIEGMDGDGKAGAAFLKRFLADSIVRDFEHLRRTEFGGARWVTLGQSYGGFLTLTYLSLFPQGVIYPTVELFVSNGMSHRETTETNRPFINSVRRVPSYFWAMLRILSKPKPWGAEEAGLVDFRSGFSAKGSVSTVFSTRRITKLCACLISA